MRMSCSNYTTMQLLHLVSTLFFVSSSFSDVFLCFFLFLFFSCSILIYVWLCEYEKIRVNENKESKSSLKEIYGAVLEAFGVVYERIWGERMRKMMMRNIWVYTLQIMQPLPRYMDKFEADWDNYLMGRVICYTIVQYLCDPVTQAWNVSCLVCSENRVPRVMIWHNMIDSVIRMANGTQRRDEQYIRVFMEHGMIRFCDVCGQEMHWSDFAYHCSNDHDMCSMCVRKHLMQHEHLVQLLHSIIGALLNDDCIYEIVSYCVGNFIVNTCRKNALQN